MRNIIIIFKKELKRFFTDKRMLASMFLPGVLIFVMYTLMGKLMQGNIFQSTPKDTTYKIAYTVNYATDTTNKPKLLSYLDSYIESEKNKVVYTEIQTSEVTTYKEKLQTKEYHLVVEFSNNFEENINVADAKNYVNLYYNSEVNASENIYGVTSSLVGSAYNNYKINYDFENNKPIEANVGENSAMLAKIISFMLPMLTVSLLYSTVISICPESISGEKERGTLASLLLTPMKRSEFVLGKVSALSVVALASGAASFLGLITSLPSLFGGTSLPFGPIECILLFVILVSTLFLFVSFGVLMSSMANTVKEAGSYLGPLVAVFMTLSIVCSVLNLTNPLFAMVPILNLSMSINALMAQAGNTAILFLITGISNLFFTGLFVFFVTKMFNKEKVVLGQ